MANEYRQTDVVGTSYQRGRTLIFENPRQAAPSLLIVEERVTNTGTRTIVEPAGEIRKEINLADLATTFPLISPQNNELLGQTATYQQLYVLLYSLYWHLAQQRDAQSS